MTGFSDYAVRTWVLSHDHSWKRGNIGQAFESSTNADPRLLEHIPSGVFIAGQTPGIAPTESRKSKVYALDSLPDRRIIMRCRCA